MLYMSLLAYKAKNRVTYTISAYDSFTKNTMKCPITRKVFTTLLSEHQFSVFKSTDEYIIYKLGDPILKGGEKI